MSGLRLRNVRKAFGAVQVIKGVDLEVEHGEFVVFVGPSGCGKSTLLRMISGLESITDGEIWIGDRLCNGVAPRDRGIAMVFQSYALYPHMSVYDNVGYALKLAGTSKAERDDRIRKAARILQMEHLLERKPAALSGGQRQRVAIGRAIVREPDVFLFDEPLSNLDAALRVDMRSELSKLHHDLGATMIYVTHDQVEAMTLADRIVVLDGGVVQQVGSPLTLYKQPANRFVAGFIGSPKMNFLPLTVTSADATGLSVAGSDLSGELTLSRIRAAPGTPLTLGLRPHHLLPDPDGALRAEVRLVERLGNETLVSLRTTSGATVVATMGGDAQVAMGSAMSFRVDVAQALVFDGGGLALSPTS
jgi:multiple sugar transport system ATP-binding protein